MRATLLRGVREAQDWWTWPMRAAHCPSTPLHAGGLGRCSSSATNHKYKVQQFHGWCCWSTGCNSFFRLEHHEYRIGFVRARLELSKCLPENNFLDKS